MKKLLLFIMLLLSVTTYSQTKEIEKSTQTVNLYWVNDSKSVFITDSVGNLIHEQMEVLRLDSTIYEGHNVILLYGLGIIISFSDLYIAYDTPEAGYVYLQPKRY